MKLDQNDYFGLIRLSKNFKKDSIKLEIKEKNQQLKEAYLSKIDKMHRSRNEALIDKKRRLEEALSEALSWQSEF